MYKIYKHKQYFKLQVPDIDIIKYKLYSFHQSLTTYSKIFIKRGKKNKVKYKVDKLYYLIDERDNSIRYPIGVFDKLLGYLNTYMKDSIDIVNVDSPEGDDIDFNMTHGFTLRKDQKDAINNTLSSNGIFLVDLPTGTGKSIIALEVAKTIGKRFAFIILPTYIDKWIKDIKQYTDITDENIYVVQGSDSLKKLMALNKSKLSKIKVIIFSMSTLRNYIKEWSNVNSTFTYPIIPEKLTYELGIGMIINDESHQEFHNLFINMLYLDTKMFLGMTATLEHKDKVINQMYEIMFPKNKRASSNKQYKKYITVVSIKYYLRNRRQIEYKTNYGYSQFTFEKSIISHSDVLHRYLELIYKMVNAMYISNKDRKPDDKILIFAGTVKMCELIRDYLRQRIKENDLKIEKYNAEDDFKVLMESNIIASTIQSAGTAVDIPDLIAVLQTVATESVQANKQTIGRLRDIGREVVFGYMWCGDIYSHRKYNRTRLDHFKDKAKEIRMLTLKSPV